MNILGSSKVVNDHSSEFPAFYWLFLAHNEVRCMFCVVGLLVASGTTDKGTPVKFSVRS